MSGPPKGRSSPPHVERELEAPGRPAGYRRLAQALARRRSLTSLAGFLALSVVLFLDVWRDPFHRTIGNGTDSNLAIWFLNWFPFALSHGHNPLLTTYLDYPAGANLMWNGSTPLLAFVLAPITATLGPFFSYNLLATLAVALSAWSAYLLFGRYVRRPVAAALGGLVYGFSPFMMAHVLGHPAVFSVFLPPLIVLLLDDALIRQRRSPLLIGAPLGLLAAAQLLIGEEVLFFTALVAAIAIVVLLTIQPGWARERVITAAQTIGLAAAVFVLTAGVPLAIQFLGPQRLHGIIQGPNSFTSDLYGFVIPSHLQLIAPTWATATSDKFIGGIAEATNSYLGIGLLIALALIMLRAWSNPTVRLATLLGVLLGILSLGQTIHIGGHVTHIPVFVLGLAFPLFQRFLPGRLMMYLVVGLWLALIRLPIFDNVLPVRLMLFVYLAAGLLLALLTNDILDAADRPWQLGGGATIALAIVLLLPAWPYPTAAPDVPRFFTDGAANQIPQGSVALIAPFSRSSLNGSRPELWQALSGFRFRMPEGYIFVPGGAEAYQSGGGSPNPPPSTTQRLLYGIERGTEGDRLTDTLQHEMLGELARWNVQTVIVGPMPNHDQVVGAFTTMLGRPPNSEGGVDVWWQVRAAP